MAKHQNSPDPSEVVIFFARAKGGGDVVAHSVRALADALERASQPRVQVRPPKTLPSSNVSNSEQLEFEVPDEHVGTDHSEIDDDITPSSISSARKKRGEGDPQDRNAGLIPIGDIDFVPSGKESLKSLFTSKAPSSDLDKIIVMLYFLQRVVASQKVGANHILTSFQHVGKPVPKDLRATIRNMKKKAWVSFTDLDDLRLTTIGENRFLHDLNKTKETEG